MEDKDIRIQFIQIEDNLADIMTKNTPETHFARHTKRIIEGELWELVDTGRENFRNARVTDDVISRDKTEYYSHTLIITIGSWSQDPGLASNEITKIEKRIK